MKIVNFCYVLLKIKFFFQTTKTFKVFFNINSLNIATKGKQFAIYNKIKFFIAKLRKKKCSIFPYLFISHN
jgi:hypothetical protein